MANQGLLAQLKPTAATDTVLYRAPIDKSASTVLTIANDGTGSVYDVAVKGYDQELTLDASTYKLHKGDVISSYYITLGTDLTDAVSVNPGQSITTSDGEKSFKVESFYVPDVTTVYVKAISIREFTLESITGTFSVGDTLSKGVAPDDTTALVYGVDGGLLYVGPSTINGGGTEFVSGDSVSATSGGVGTVSASPAITTAEEEFVFSTTTAGGVYNGYFGGDGGLFEIFNDRTYRFDVSDASMTGRDLKLSTTVNGEWGPDGLFGTGDDGAEYTTGKTTNGTAGSASAYVQYAFGVSVTPDPLYIYDGGTGTATNAGYGGGSRTLEASDVFEYPGFYIYDKVGTIGDSVDSFTLGAVTYTITAQSAGPYGYVKDYTGTTLQVIKGLNSADFAGTDTFRDVPKDTASVSNRTLATVSAVVVASNAVEASNYIVEGLANGNNEVDKITSLVVGPGEVVVVNSATANNTFSLIGFEDDSDSFTVRVFEEL